MTWPVADAKARFSELLDAAINEGPQAVSRRGVETAVVVPIAEWKRIQGRAEPKAEIPRRSLKEILLDPSGPHDLYIPPRGKLLGRPPFQFD